MNFIALSFLWCVLQVTIVCIVAMFLQEILRRWPVRSMISTSAFALFIVVGLTAFALSPWPRWGAPQQQTVNTLPVNLALPDALPRQASIEQSKPLVTDVIATGQIDWKDRLSDLLERIKKLVAPLASLVLPLLALSVLLGGGRFALGLIAIHRTVRNSTAIDDGRLTIMLTDLQSTLGCNGTIRLLESDQIGSPATVGWRNPTVLLPTQWTTWSMEQTRAVLAHEIAHISRGDFRSIVLAQLSTVFHFYHPLVHRLVECLRLEQELSADAVASSIVGGNQQYLAVLAAMTLHDQPLRTESQQTPWPARPFLPAPKTLLRRIEMLQTANPSDVSVSMRARIAAVALILVAGVVAAGLRPVTVLAQEDAKPAIDTNDKKSPNTPPLKIRKTLEPYADDYLAGLDAKDYESVERQLTKQLSERPDDGDLRFRLALIQNELGKTEEALALMRQLVAANRYKEAARWIVREKFNKRKWSDMTQAERDEFGSLVTLMYEESPDDPAVKNLYADYLIASGDLVKAFPILRDLWKENPLRGLQAAAVARRLKRFDEANEIAQRSLDAMSAMSDEGPANLAVSLAVAQNQLFLKRFPDSIETLEKAIKLAKTPQEQDLARQAYGDAICAHVKHIQDNSEETVAQRIRILKMLQVAIANSPKNPRVLTLINQQLSETRDDDNADIATLRKALKKAMENAKANPDDANAPVL